MTESNELVAAVQVLVQLAELADRLTAAQDTDDYKTIEALCEQNRSLRPLLAQSLQGLRSYKPQTQQEHELVTLAVSLVQKIRDGDKAFAIWQVNLDRVRTVSPDHTAYALSNVTRMCDMPPMDVLDNLFDGVPAIIVAAGPSLDKNLELVHELHDRAVIITMNRCASIFQGEELKPHFLMASDSHADLPEIHLRGIDGDILENFVLRPSVHPSMLDLPYVRTFLFTDGSTYEKGLLEAMGKSSRAVGGGTVGHSCLLLAFHLGCNPITVIGQDLAYGGERAYSSRDLDASIRLTVDADNAVCTVHTGDATSSHLGMDSEIQLESVPAWGGGTVPTTKAFRHFIEFYEVMVKALKAERELTFLNATEGGAHIEGMEEMSLREVIDRYMTQPIEGLRRRIAMAHASYVPAVSNEQMAETIRSLEQQMVRLHNLTTDGERLVQSKKRSQHRLQRANELQKRMMKILATHDYLLHDIFRGKMSKERPSEDPWDQLSCEFRALRSAVEDLLPGCREAVRTLSQ